MNKPKKGAASTPRFEYPKHVDLRVGCKVSWAYYASEADADKASKVAKREAVYRAGQGFDFGFCCPGDVIQVTDGKHAGLFEVCLP